MGRFSEAIASVPGHAQRFVQAIAEIPDHVQALGVLALGAVVSLTHEHATGQALIAAGLAMWKGKSNS